MTDYFQKLSLKFVLLWYYVYIAMIMSCRIAFVKGFNLVIPHNDRICLHVIAYDLEFYYYPTDRDALL